MFNCVKSVQIRSYFWSVFSNIQSEYRKIRSRSNSVFGHFSRLTMISANWSAITNKIFLITLAQNSSFKVSPFSKITEREMLCVAKNQRCLQNLVKLKIVFCFRLTAFLPIYFLLTHIKKLVVCSEICETSQIS